jgi:acylphosphatase
MTRTVRLRIEGRVQGVSFRDWMQAQARGLGLTGWVRNRRDGSVEAVISGDPELVDDMLARCRQGPPAARVSNLAILSEPDESFADFEILDQRRDPGIGPHGPSGMTRTSVGNLLMSSRPSERQRVRAGTSR